MISIPGIMGMALILPASVGLTGVTADVESDTVSRPALTDFVRIKERLPYGPTRAAPVTDDSSSSERELPVPEQTSPRSPEQVPSSPIKDVQDTSLNDTGEAVNAIESEIKTRGESLNSDVRDRAQKAYREHQERVRELRQKEEAPASDEDRGESRMSSRSEAREESADVRGRVNRGASGTSTFLSCSGNEGKEVADTIKTEQGRISYEAECSSSESGSATATATAN